ncbi:MAG: SUMF1/EgtB/PvdO family nonheme iron enzyme [Bacteroidia bacterium]|nr:SUMF1/EgtB/PvdO family nonheme iron enzyme [Bacteroidia bacterium]MDW8158248.1 SUMF1/EgtB/PvdO family nonheme iron enzyme [Bacteroidia bacterium]
MILRILLLLVGAILLSSCKKVDLNKVPPKSDKLGYKWNEGPKSSQATGEEGFKPISYKQPLAPGLVFIEGGTFIMGGGEKDINYDMSNRERQVTVHSFYIDETEVANIDWKHFIHFLEKDSGPEKARWYYPDTTVWYRDLAYNEPFVEYYYQNPAFNMYPVVGVNWYQANDYCKWRTSIYNEKLKDEAKEGTTPILSPNYRLPTEAEWEYAARGLLEQQNYPWEGKSLRNAKGRFRANFKRGRGDYAGRSNAADNTRLVEGLNDGYMIPNPVKAFMPNDFGLYNMAGNVAEWTMDTYRTLAYEDVEDFQPFRRKGDVEDQLEKDIDYSKENSLLMARPYKKPTNPNAYDAATYHPVERDAQDRVKVYRGGSWKDIAYYLTCGARRFWFADSSSSTIGFRCAMIRVGSPSLKY